MIRRPMIWVNVIPNRKEGHAMRRMLATLGSLALLGSISSPARAEGSKAPDGKAIFVQSKCGACHTIKSQGIVKDETGKPGVAPSRKPPDLSTVGKERKAEWIVAFMKKEETIDGRKHPKLFRGTDADLATLAAWLETMKAEPTKEKDKAGK